MLDALDGQLGAGELPEADDADAPARAVPSGDSEASSLASSDRDSTSSPAAEDEPPGDETAEDDVHADEAPQDDPDTGSGRSPRVVPLAARSNG